VAFAHTLAARLKRTIRVRGRRISRQPYDTRQCGIHTIVRAFLSSIGIDAALPSDSVADFEPLRQLLPGLSKNDTKPFLSAALVATARPAQLHTAINKKAIQPLEDAFVTDAIKRADKGHRFLTAKHNSSNSLASQWQWGITTVNRHNRTSAATTWAPIMSNEAPYDVYLPSANFHIYAFAPLVTAPTVWDVSTTITVESDSAVRAQSTSPLDPNAPSYSQVATASLGSVRQPSRSSARQGSPDPTQPLFNSTPSRSASHVSATPAPQRTEVTPTPRAATTRTTNAPRTAPTIPAPAPIEVSTYESTLTLLSQRVIDAVRHLPHKHPGQFIGRDIANLHILETSEVTIPELALQGLAESTRDCHRNLLKECAFLPRDLLDVPLDRALLEWLCREQKKRKWLYSTLSTKIASLAGALRLLPLYTDNHPAIHMSLSTIWGQAAKASAQAEKLTAPRRAAPASWSDVDAILVREKHSRASIAILLAWLTCGRVADVLRLKPNDIIIGAERLTVTFRDTKTRNTYTVATALPPAQHITIFTDVIESATYARPVFHDNLKAQISRALKAQRPALTQHSLRRGAIQTLAKSGVSAKHLLNFSGHKTMASLLTYLDDGITAPGLDLQTAQARVLVGGGSNDDPSEAPPPSTTTIHKRGLHLLPKPRL
jgi:integrase